MHLNRAYASARDKLSLLGVAYDSRQASIRGPAILVLARRNFSWPKYPHTSFALFAVKVPWARKPTQHNWLWCANKFLPTLAFIIKVAHHRLHFTGNRQDAHRLQWCTKWTYVNSQQLHHHFVMAMALYLAHLMGGCSCYGFGFAFVLSSVAQAIFGPILPRRNFESDSKIFF